MRTEQGTPKPGPPMQPHCGKAANLIYVVADETGARAFHWLQAARRYARGAPDRIVLLVSLACTSEQVSGAEEYARGWATGYATAMREVRP